MSSVIRTYVPGLRLEFKSPKKKEETEELFMGKSKDRETTDKVTKVKERQR